MTCEHLCERALTRAVRPHDRMHFAIANREIHALQDLVARDGDTQPFDFEQTFPLLHPTLPSRLIPSNRVASTANSIGSSLNTSLQKPLTIIEIGRASVGKESA